jgi:hypothetical protein
LDDTITTTYYLCDEFLKAVGYRDDPQARLSTAEVMTVPLVACALFSANIEASRSFLDEYGYIDKSISKSRFNRRLHAIDPCLWEGLFALLAEAFKHEHSEQTYVVDSLPVAVCDNIRIRRCKLYPPQEHAGAFRGYIPSKRRYFYGLRVHLVLTEAGEAVEFSLVGGSEADVSVFKDLELDLCPRARSSWPTRPTPTTITRTCSKRSACTSRPSARRTQRDRCPPGRSSWASRSASTSRRCSAD